MRRLEYKYINKKNKKKISKRPIATSVSSKLEKNFFKPRKSLKAQAVIDIKAEAPAKQKDYRSELAVKLFPDTPKRRNSVRSNSVRTKHLNKINMIKKQEEWIKRNSRPVYKHLSEYEKFENEFIRGRTERMDLPGHASTHSAKGIVNQKESMIKIFSLVLIKNFN